jgi:hypothetical protein
MVQIGIVVYLHVDLAGFQNLSGLKQIIPCFIKVVNLTR